LKLSSRFALEGLSESVAYEVERFGIKVILIEPGVVKTNFDSNPKIGKGVSPTTSAADTRDSPYANITRRRIAGFRPRFENGLCPIEVY
jgi:NAD(P)-dependent dehydrogenase (short-subunit alcohol dehydrogenase family)